MDFKPPRDLGQWTKPFAIFLPIKSSLLVKRSRILVLYSVSENSKKTCVRCPQCRAEYKIGKKGEKQFPQNSYILASIEKKNVEKELCKKMDALQKMANQKQRDDVPYCTIHDEMAFYFCANERCLKCICFECVDDEHKNHSVGKVDVKGKEYRDILLKDIDAALGKVQKNEKVLRNVKEDLKLQIDANLKKMYERQKTLVKTLNELFSNMKEDINNCASKGQKRIDEIENALKTNKRIVKIRDDITNAPNWLLLQIMADKEKELNSLIGAVNACIAINSQLEVKKYEEANKNLVARKIDQAVETRFFEILKEKLISRQIRANLQRFAY